MLLISFFVLIFFLNDPTSITIVRYVDGDLAIFFSVFTQSARGSVAIDSCMRVFARLNSGSPFNFRCLAKQSDIQMLWHLCFKYYSFKAKVVL